VNKASLVLILLGGVLIATAGLHKLGYITFGVTGGDDSPPQFIYTFPSDNMTCLPNYVDEIVAYVKDVESNITSVIYTDKYGTVALTLTPYTEIKHRMLSEEEVFPDVNLDGIVGDYEANEVQNRYGAEEGDPNYDPRFDFNSDGIIDISDAVYVDVFYGTGTFSVTLTTPRYGAGEEVSFVFKATNQYGLVSELSGTLSIQDYEPLMGEWYVNGKLVEGDNMAVQTNSSVVTIEFVKGDQTIDDGEITAVVIVKGTTCLMDNVSPGTWRTDIEVTDETTTLLLKAYTETHLSQKQVVVQMLTFPHIEIDEDTVLLIIGVIMVVAGILVYEKEDTTVKY